MASTPKIRMLAGPNGSGKSTLLNYLAELSHSERFPLGFVLNPDDIERELRDHGHIYLGSCATQLTTARLHAHLKAHAMTQAVDVNDAHIAKGVLYSPSARSGYFASAVCDLLRQRWIAASESFTFETVMSHESKPALLAEAKARGYRAYLYYICTEAAEINESRVENRVADGGHDVPAQKLNDRYGRSLKLAALATRLANRAYHFDNSGSEHRLIAEFDSGTLVKVADPLPNWFVTHVLNKG